MNLPALGLNGLPFDSAFVFEPLDVDMLVQLMIQRELSRLERWLRPRMSCRCLASC
jgi:hypothetical protein